MSGYRVNQDSAVSTDTPGMTLRRHFGQRPLRPIKLRGSYKGFWQWGHKKPNRLQRVSSYRNNCRTANTSTMTSTTIPTTICGYGFPPHRTLSKPRPAKTEIAITPTIRLWIVAMVRHFASRSGGSTDFRALMAAVMRF
jgi:hypothetical protein